MNKNNSYGKSTTCVHGGNYIDEKEHGVITPIFTSTAYDYENVERQVYPRYNNTVNQRVVSEKIRALEDGEDAMVFSSGLSAIMTAFFTFLKQGDHAVIQHDIYGGSYHALSTECAKFGIELTFVNGHRKKDFQHAIKDSTRLIFIETPSNPLLKIVDIQKVAELGTHEIVTMIDNTFASPINQTPIDQGIDIVMHSGTKYLAGHSDLTCGALISKKDIMAKIRETAINFGGLLDARGCYILERSLKTLDLRVKRQNENAGAIAEFLNEQHGINKVYYPGLPSHDGHKIAQLQMSGSGAMVSFEVDGDAAAFINHLEIISRAMSLGGVESTICLPSETSHSKISPEERVAMGINDNLVRMSVGIENEQDLIHDLRQALSKI